MKTQEIKDLQTKTTAELITLLQAAQKNLMTLKLDHEQNKLQNTSSISNTRKDIAVMQTILNMKQKIEGKTAQSADTKVLEAKKEKEDKK